MKTAVLVDGAFFIKRYKYLVDSNLDAGKVARAVSASAWRLMRKCNKHDHKQRKTLQELEEKDVYYEMKQAGVDMRIGLDIASLSSAGNVDQIILIAGDSDFVPAAKMARRYGIDFVLDPEWHTIRPELLEHIDGLCSVFPRHQNNNQARA